MPVLGGSPSNGTLPQPQGSGLSDRNSFVPGPLQFNTASSSTKTYQTGLDEFGYGRPDVATPPSRASTLYPDESASQPTELRAATGRRANSYSQSRFTITNISEDDDHDLRVIGASSPSASRSQWLTAEEEKKRLYEEANAKVARVQGAAARKSPPPPIDTSPVCSYQ
jgi:hypothetical protein